MSSKDVDNLFTWAGGNDLDVIFGLNVLLRDSKTNLWNSTNAEQLMRYLHSRGFSCVWELGNEPFDLHGLINRTIAPTDLAKNFKILRKLVDKHPEYGHMIVGPDVASPWKPPLRNRYFSDFLASIDGAIDALTYHQYYTNNKANVSKFYDVNTLDDLITDIDQIKLILEKSRAASLKLWMGETSSAYGGGAPGISNSYIAGFMWLDKLGVAARLGHQVVVRQTFYGGDYALVNPHTYDLYPDYWSSHLYKILVGQRVLAVGEDLHYGRAIRVYAHCTSKSSGYSLGSIVLIALNTQHTDAKLILTKEFQKLPVHQYLLTPGNYGNLTSQTTRLNNDLLQLINDKTLPQLKPKLITSDDMVLPPVSYGFYVIPDTHLEACEKPCNPDTKSRNIVKV